ncbi:hypothetical protein AVEN_273048-1 [Araneus ventricosus]|uniref:Uncharacterized protein n=1 Tax=Araneus ventricosus TaxID=182803 RepID=A0A4Y2M482_ARAVE|nr:hypothetical protein AVEN_273048-1 [Araneus ventricosus]
MNVFHVVDDEHDNRDDTNSFSAYQPTNLTPDTEIKVAYISGGEMVSPTQNPPIQKYPYQTTATTVRSGTLTWACPKTSRPTPLLSFDAIRPQQPPSDLEH